MLPRFARLSRAVLLPALLLPLALAVPGVARADDAAVCLRTNENSQKLRREKKLKEALEELKVCSQTSCPGAIQRDCTQWLREVEAVLPTLSFSAKDQKGGDLTDVSVSMDGQLLLQQLDGSAVPVDPGKHTFTFSRQGEPDTSQDVLVNEGDKARKVEVRFQGEAEKPSGPRYSSYPFVFGGIGLAGLVTGSALFIVGKNRFPSECEGDLPEGEKGLSACRTDDDNLAKRANSAITQSNVGMGLMIGGGLVLAGGITWFLVETFTGSEKKAEQSARRAPAPRIVPTFGLGTLGVQGTF